MRKTHAVVAILAAIVLGGCEFVTDPSPETGTTTQSPTTTVPAPTTTEPKPSPTETAPTPPSEAELPGEAIEGYPQAGTGLTIVGVPATEILNLRIGPGTDYVTVARLAPSADLIATGRSRALQDGIWNEVHADGELGWVSARYLAQLGASLNVTDQFDPPPSAATRADLIEQVVRMWDQTPEPESAVVYGPVETDGLQFHVDVLTRDDDSVMGARLFVVADNSGEEYVVTKVTATQLCVRGISTTGECL